MYLYLYVYIYMYMYSHTHIVQGCAQTVLRLSAQNQGHSADAADFKSRVFARPAAAAE